MSILGLYDHMWWDAPEADDIDDDQLVPELLTVSAGCGWWSASLELADVE